MRCAVYGCSQCTPYKTGEIADTKISFHVFPSNKIVCKQWVRLCRRKDKINTKNARICSKHFRSDDFITPNPVYAQHGMEIKAQIKRGIAPSLFLPMQKQLNLSTPRNIRSMKRTSAKNIEAMETEVGTSDSTSNNYEVDSPDQIMIIEPISVGKMDCSTTCSDSTSNNFEVDSPDQIMIIEPISVGKMDCSTQTKSVITEKFNCTGPVCNTGTQTDSDYIPYSQLQEEVAQLRQKCRKQQNTINSLGHIFTKRQILKLGYPEKRATWTSDDISNAITIHAAGPRAYRLLLRNKYPLPAVITLKKWCAKIGVYPGILQCVLNIMKQVDMTVIEKICVLSFDEMKVKEKIVYDKTKDETLKASKYVQVAMVRGIFGNWKQPIYYQFDQKMTQSILFEIIKSIENCGFRVVATVCDLGGSNQGLIRDLNITVQTPFFINPLDDSKKIYMFADVPHLMKLIRNNFVDNDGFEIHGEVINKNVIEELISKTNNKSDLSIAYKISAANLNVRGAERQKVKLATKLFSHTVSSAIIRAGSLGELTSESWLKCDEFFKQVNDWFDCLNVRVPYKDSRERVQGVGISESTQFETVQQMSDVMLNMRVKGKRNMMPFQKGVIMTNNALRLLYKDLKSQYDVTYLLTYRLNQDVLENFFGVIRAKGGLYDHPDRLEFMYRLRSYILGRNEGSLSLNGNTLVDDTPDLETADSLSSNFFKSLNSGINISEEAPEDDLKSLQYDGLEHLAGYICHKMNNPELVIDNNAVNTNKDSSFTWTNQLSEGFLQKPTEKMMQEMQELEFIFQQFNGDHIIYCRNYIKTLMELSLHVPSEPKIKELFFRSRMYFRIKHANTSIIDNSRLKHRKSNKTIL